MLRIHFVVVIFSLHISCATSEIASEKELFQPYPFPPKTRFPNGEYKFICTYSDLFPCEISLTNKVITQIKQSFVSLEKCRKKKQIGRTQKLEGYLVFRFGVSFSGEIYFFRFSDALSIKNIGMRECLELSIRTRNFSFDTKSLIINYFIKIESKTRFADLDQ